MTKGTFTCVNKRKDYVCKVTNVNVEVYKRKSSRANPRAGAKGNEPFCAPITPANVGFSPVTTCYVYRFYRFAAKGREKILKNFLHLDEQHAKVALSTALFWTVGHGEKHGES